MIDGRWLSMLGNSYILYIYVAKFRELDIYIYGHLFKNFCAQQSEKPA